MSTKATLLDHATEWDKICFPIEVAPLVNLLNEPYLVPSDRSRAVIGEVTPGQKTIFAMQSGEYTLIPNTLVREVAEQQLPGHSLRASFTDRGEFCLSIIMPDEINDVATTDNSKVRDRLFRSLIINNSYSGKTPFSLQGSAEWEREQTSSHSKMRVSYYREVCTNGLMGWADDYYTVDEYLNWLAAGKPTKHRKIQQEKEHELVEVTEREVKREHEILVERKFAHKGLNLQIFKQHLEQAFQQFVQQRHSLTTEVYKQLSRQAVTGDREKLFADTKLPKKLASAALERLAYEETLLQTDANLWLAYNAANYALFNSKSSLAINDRFRQDEHLFHHFAELAMS
ncbi:MULTISPECIES: hypothetical protein [Hymenobacter]|uniref:DUF932 domain-containing protein n=1 Tax=Hymenobacter mucosus TaxID=1411120 RepID=A0A239B000_9BACT|nr:MULTISPECIES: hypothetical protein [Hymenobacter]MDF7815562.1 hypothetical protein [Hymenobacter sp. YC55]SNS00951.1 hypothetical protein SAMN06269173_11660 [Hymenobacter mucosus]